jgi:UDP-N-acetylglucosamine 2-epimerase (non-hydrolysing)
MSRLFFDELGLPPPDVDLEVGSGSHAWQTGLVMQRFEPLLVDWRPALVLVVGDVNSTLAASLTAAKLCIPVAHVEAGLRSFDRTMPEEINRVLTDALAELLFVSEPSGVENLAREGIGDARVQLVGNVMIDTLRRHRERAAASGVLERLGVEARRYGVMTLHRPSNVDSAGALSAVLTPIVELSRSLPIVFPVHPRAGRPVREYLAALPGADGLRCIEPLGYLDFVRLMSEARIVLTDSGGIQEETTVLGTPCVTLRDNTERPVTLTHGTNVLGGTEPTRIRAAIETALAMPVDPTRPAPPLWDGRAAQRIAERLAAWAGRG